MALLDHGRGNEPIKIVHNIVMFAECDIFSSAPNSKSKAYISIKIMYLRVWEGRRQWRPGHIG